MNRYTAEIGVALLQQIQYHIGENIYRDIRVKLDNLKTAYYKLNEDVLTVFLGRPYFMKIIYRTLNNVPLSVCISVRCFDSYKKSISVSFFTDHQHFGKTISLVNDLILEIGGVFLNDVMQREFDR